MRGDFSRLRFSPSRNYTAVLQQQGRVALDADANEQCAIGEYLRATETIDVVGPVGGPIHDEGFKITVQNGVIRIGKGRYYVEGILCANEHRLAYAEQPFLVDPDPTDQALINSLQQGSISAIQVYLQVWRRLVTALDDPCLREPALGLADTTARVQTVWRVVASGVTSTLSNQSTESASGGCCASMETGLVRVPNQGKLNAQTSGDIDDCSCQPTPAAGYRGLENQLYRVEIHHSGDASSATFKWSRENGSVVSAITSVSGPQVWVDRLGPDANLSFCTGQWVEISDDTYEFGQAANQPGNLYQIKSISGLCVTLTQSVAVDPTRNARMRRWDQVGSTATVDGVGVSTGFIDLENGIQVEFSPGQYVSGSYWLIPARTATGQIDWPPCDGNGAVFQPPHDIDVFVAPLACIRWDGQKQGAVVDDCRKPFYPLTELTPAGSCCTYRVGDGVNTFGDFTSIQTAIDSLPDEGGEICILPGIYYENVSIVGCSNVVIHGCGWQTRLASASLGPAAARQKNQQAAGATSSTGAANPIAAVIAIAGSRHIKLRSFVVEAADDEAGILIDGTGTAFTPAQPAQLVAFNPNLLQLALDIAVEDMVLAAATFPAILAKRARLLRIEKNRVAMKNVASTWPAIFASGREIEISRNWVALQSATNIQQWLPTVVAQDLSGAGSDAGVSAGSLSGSSSSFSVPISTSEDPALLNTFFSEVAPSDLNQAPILGHPGGIQIGGHSADILLEENEIQGGSRNGITLGSLSSSNSDGSETSQWIGLLQSGAKDTASLLVSESPAGAVGNAVVSGGIMSNIQIRRNRIRNMGLCGIGPVAFWDLTQTPEIITTSGLTITENAISQTLRRELVTVTGSAKDNLGYGAVCLPDAQNLTIRDNSITDFGAKPGAYVCGIFVLHGELVDISRNQVLETRDWSEADSDPPPPTGTVQGGILLFATPPNFPQPLDSSPWVESEPATYAPATRVSAPIYEPGLPAVRIEHNVVRVALGGALGVGGLGQFSIVNNHFATGGLIRSRGRSLAQTVYILNLGTSIETATEASLPSGIYGQATTSNNNLYSAPSSNFSCGAILFTNNICQLEASAGRQTEYVSVAIITPDHLTFSNNHCWLDALRLSAYFDALLIGGSLSVVGNRFQEKIGSTLFSGLTIGVANITNENISTNCLLALGLWLKHSNNIAFVNEIVPSLCTRLQEELSDSK